MFSTENNIYKYPIKYEYIAYCIFFKIYISVFLCKNTNLSLSLNIFCLF